MVSNNDTTIKELPGVSTNLMITPEAISIKTNKELCYPIELAYKEDGKKIAFLTFDDGPSSTNTSRILEVLKHYNIKATFFVIGYEAKKNPDILIDMRNEGHAIGNHTYSHNYDKIYSKVEKFIEDVKKNEDVLKHILGGDFKTRICRFPGGSFGEGHKNFVKELNKSGYVEINWNTIIGDAEGINVEPGKLFKRLIATSKEQKHLVILMHDSPSKNTTVEVLPEIIEYLEKQGYEFATLE